MRLTRREATRRKAVSLRFSRQPPTTSKPFVDLGQQLRDLLRRVLEVGVQRHHDLAARHFEAGEDGGVLAVVAVERDHRAPADRGAAMLAQDLERAVARCRRRPGSPRRRPSGDRVHHRRQPLVESAAGSASSLKTGMTIETRGACGWRRRDDDSRRQAKRHAGPRGPPAPRRPRRSSVIDGKSGSETMREQTFSATGQHPLAIPEALAVVAVEMDRLEVEAGADARARAGRP